MENAKRLYELAFRLLLRSELVRQVETMVEFLVDEYINAVDNDRAGG